MVKFLRNFDSRGIKIARVNSILITDQFTEILNGVRVRFDRGRFFEHSPFIYMSMCITFKVDLKWIPEVINQIPLSYIRRRLRNIER